MEILSQVGEYFLIIFYLACIIYGVVFYLGGKMKYNEIINGLFDINNKIKDLHNLVDMVTDLVVDDEIKNHPIINHNPNFDETYKMPVHGKYPKGAPEGLVVHYTAGWGRVEHGDEDAINVIMDGISKSYGYWCISPIGKIYKTTSLSDYSYHCGDSAWKDIKGCNSHFLGVEMCCPGKVEKISDNEYKSWFGEKYTKEKIRYSESKENIEKGFYVKYNENQEKSLVDLCLWLREQYPDTFTFDNVVGHDEICIPKGRKQDPGASLSYGTMTEFRNYLKKIYEE